MYNASGEWYFLTQDDERVANAANSENLGLDNLSREYMIDFTNQKVYIVDGITSGASTLYDVDTIIMLYKDAYK